MLEQPFPIVLLISPQFFLPIYPRTENKIVLGLSQSWASLFYKESVWIAVNYNPSIFPPAKKSVSFLSQENLCLSHLKNLKKIFSIKNLMLYFEYDQFLSQIENSLQTIKEIYLLCLKPPYP